MNDNKKKPRGKRDFVIVTVLIFTTVLAGVWFLSVNFDLSKETKTVKRLQNSGWGGTFRYHRFNLGISWLDNKVNSSQFFKKIRRVKQIDINLRKFDDESFQEISTFKSLKSLTIINSQITDLSPSEKLTRLESVNLDDSQIVDLSPLKNLIRLNYLQLLNANITDISPLKELKNLKTLNLDYNKIEILPCLNKLTILEKLSLDGNQIKDIEPLQGLINLKFLNLYSNNVSDLSALKGLTNLKTLLLFDTPNLTKAEIGKLQKALPNCNISHNAKK